MTNDKRKCDKCAVTLHGECYVDGALLLCGPCAENLDSEREFNEEFEGEEYRMLLVPTAHDEPPLSFELFRHTYCTTTTNNTFAALPASEETLDLSRDAMRDHLRTVAERQREADTRNVCGDTCRRAIRRTPLVTEGEP